MAGEGANVRSIDVIQEFRAKLQDYVELSERGLAEAEADIQRTITWLRHDRTAYWGAEIKRRNRLVDQAKSDLFRAQVSAAPDNPSAGREERKKLSVAQSRLAEAEEKRKRTQRWIRELERAFMLYRGQVGQMAGALAGDMPKAMGELEGYSRKLEDYLAVRAPSNDPRVRAGDRLTPPPEAAETPESPESPESPEVETEDGAAVQSDDAKPRTAADDDVKEESP